MSILEVSVTCKSRFKHEIKKFNNLRPVHVPNWAGIGALRYIPDNLIVKYQQIIDYQAEKLNHKLRLEAAETQKQEEKKEDEKVSVQTDSEVQQKDTENGPKDENEKEIIPTSDSNVDILVEDEQYEKYIKELNDLNERIVKKLQAQDGAFSLSVAQDNLNAVKLGMVNGLDVVSNLAQGVNQIGKDIEESNKFVEIMSEMVRVGIEKAKEDLKKENELKNNQQGILSKIPIVNGIFSWLAPAQSHISTTTGRTFNLQSGKVASTEVIYKYHMQVEEVHDKKSDENSKEDTVSVN
jgi:hypothetical protein